MVRSQQSGRRNVSPSRWRPEGDEIGMAQTFEVDGSCPVCGDAMIVTRLSCARCGSSLEGTFQLSGVPGRRTPSGPLGARAGGRADDEARFGRLARLDPAQLDFVEAF